MEHLLQNSFKYSRSLVAIDGDVIEIISLSAKAKAAFRNRRYPSRHYDIRLQPKGNVYNASVGSVLFYDCETWSFGFEKARRFPYSNANVSEAWLESGEEIV